MGASNEKVGGTAGGQGLSEDFVSFLTQMLNTGGIGAGTPAGADAVSATGGIAGTISDVLSRGGGQVGGALAQILERDQLRATNTLREQFGASGGAQFGTPAAFAQSRYQAEAAPQITRAIGDMQMNAANSLLQLISGVYNRETPQAEIIQQPGALQQILGAAGAIAPTAMNLLAPGLGSAVSLDVGTGLGAIGDAGLNMSESELDRAIRGITGGGGGGSSRGNRTQGM